MSTVLYPPPDPSAVYWQREKKNGEYEFASIQAMKKDEHGNWRALFLVPGQAPFYINQYSNELGQWEPVFALTEDSIELVVERIAQRVAALLQEKGKDHGEIVSAAMEVIEAESVEGAIETAMKSTSPEEEKEGTDPDFYITENFKKEKKKFICGVCGKKYAYEKSLRNHIMKKQCSPSEPVPENPDS